MSLLENLARIGLLKLDAEKAHLAGIKALKRGAVRTSKRIDKDILRVDLAGLSFPNPIGIAAGFDKNAEVPDALLKRGMGFAEVGTVTPRAQAGNPAPRVFRLPEHKAVINRLGFNNEGHAAAYQRLAARRLKGGIVGVNIGANKDSADFVQDYVAGIRCFADVASYFTANISSPNTPGLRDLQAARALRALLVAVRDARDEEALRLGYAVPVFLKIAPDISVPEIETIAGEVLESGIEGLIVSNTTVLRDRVKGHPLAAEAGGLSGAPLFDLSTLVLARMRRAVGPSFPIIGVGGITDGATALTKMRAGANLLQVYTGLIYRGFDLIDDVKDTLEAAVRRERVASVAGLVGLDAERISHEGHRAPGRVS
ncbi:MAG: quinone-dependent dihydroorotate dehydrogenase [Rhizobiales bacterium]|nr:quinone-dependent dihydroorotate dehydrogenase [Hyphomicrobiales bacterium]